MGISDADAHKGKCGIVLRVVVVEWCGPQTHRESHFNLVTVFPDIGDLEIGLRRVGRACNRDTIDSNEVVAGTCPLWDADDDIEGTTSVDRHCAGTCRIDRETSNHLNRDITRQLTKCSGGRHELVDQQGWGSSPTHSRGL